MLNIFGVYNSKNVSMLFIYIYAMCVCVCVCVCVLTVTKKLSALSAGIPSPRMINK